MNKLIPAMAVLAMSVPALAQQATSPASPGAQPAPPAISTPSASVDLSSVISANKLINESVTNAANETIGDVNDVLLSSDGKVAAVIVGVGGFLGLGEKDVALPFDQLSFAKDSDGALRVSTSMTKEGLQTAPEYVKPENRN
jgi:hypothetical protein